MNINWTSFIVADGQCLLLRLCLTNRFQTNTVQDFIRTQEVDFTCQPDGAAVHTSSKTCFVTEGRSPVSLTVTVFVAIAHLQRMKNTFGD